MKKYSLYLLTCIFVLSFFNVNESWAKNEPTFYAKLKTQVGTGCTNMGKVYAGTSNSEGTYDASSSESDELSQKASTEGAESLQLGPFYAFAKAEKEYKFVGWKETNSASAEYVSDKSTYPITLTSTAQKSGGYTKTLYAFFVAKTSVNITFIGSDRGTYQYTIGSSAAQTVNSSGAYASDVESVTLSAPTPASSGYVFAGWYQINTDGSVVDLSSNSTFEVDFSVSGSVQIGARFVSTSLPKFLIKETSTEYYGLKAACVAAAAGQTIVPTGNHTIDGSDLISADNLTYIIPSGVMLLLPYDAGYSVSTNSPTSSDSGTKPTPFRKLTFGANVKMKVSGSICVNAKIRENQNTNGAQDGSCGMIDLPLGSQIELQNGANLYVWGCITGAGDIFAHSGSAVYEAFQVNSYPGGTFLMGNTSSLESKEIFPVPLYSLPNIQPKLHIENGASESLTTAFSGLGVINEFKFISNNGGLFQLGTGATVTKWYDKTTDRQRYQVEGDVTLQSITLTVATIPFYGDVNVNSADYILPLTHNMQVDINSGTTTIANNISLLPGAIINVAESANVNINSGVAVYVYDVADWEDNYTFAGGSNKSVVYGRTTTMSYAKTNLSDATLSISGTVTANGALYTTASGANVIGTEGGLLKIKTLGSATTIYQAIQSGSSLSSTPSISVTPAKLHNAKKWYESPYVGAGKACEYLASEANKDVRVANGHWGWMEIWKDEDVTVLKAINTCTQQAGTAPSNPSQPCKTFAEWSDVTPTTNQEVIHTATYTDNTYAITYSAGTNGSGTVTGGTKTCGVDFTLSTDKFTRTGYEQTGWSIEDSGAKVYEMGGTYSTDEAKTFYPFWTVNPYTITFDSNGGSSVASITQNYGTAVTAPADPSREGYTFDGWSPAVPSTMPVNGLTCVAQWTVNPYTITFDSNGGSSVASITQNYGTAVTAPADPTREGYTFNGWSPAVPSTMPVNGLTCVAQWTVNPYTITFDSNGGSSVASITQNYGTAVTAPADPSREGYTFDGWSPAVPSTMPVNGLTCVAQWTVNPYTITFDSNGGSAVASITQNYGTAVTAPADPTREGYMFNGWSPAVPSTMPVNGLTCVAQWTVNPYTITFDSNGGSAVASITQNYGTAVTAPADPTRTGYTFEGWYKEEECTNAWDFDSDVVEGNTTLYAKWTANKYKITWWDAQETLENHVIAVEEYEYGEMPSYTYNKPSDYAYSYEILGWTPALVPVTADKTYTALYNAIPLTLVVNNEQTISDNVTLNSTTVRVSGALRIAPSASLTTTDLILEASAENSGEITGNVVANNVYFDLAIEADKRHWNVFGVPFEIGDLDNTKLQYKNSGETTWHNMILGTHYDITYHDEATRASRGPVYDCWKYIEDLPAGNRTLQPGVAYSISLLFHVDTLRFTKASNSQIHYSENVDLVNTNTGDATNGGWNGIANPTTYHTLLATGVDMIQIHDGGEIGHDTYDAYRIEDYKFVVGKAGYVQVTAAHSILNVKEAGGQAPIPSVHAAPRRSNGITASELYTVELSAENMRTDRVYVKADEDKADEYTIGSDVMKLSTSQARPQIWVEQYNVKLCKSTMAPVNGQTVYPLGLYAPVAGEYTITNNQSAEVEEENTLYLTYDGLPIWNLTDAPYSIQLEKGTNMHYGLLLVRNYAPSVTTGTEEIQTGLPAAQKVIWNDQVYILRGGEVYTVTGKKVQ